MTTIAGNDVATFTDEESSRIIIQ